MEENKQNIFACRGCNSTPELLCKKNHIYSKGHCKMDAYNWLEGIPISSAVKAFDCVEIRFKNDRKDFYRITDNQKYYEGGLVAVEGSPGHDIGIITLFGETARLQMLRKNVDYKSEEVKKAYRMLRASDIDKWISFVSKEKRTRTKTREIVNELGLEMKINDIEYQGDGSKATFYYTAEGRVDFRELIQLLAGEFRVRIEMKQIGVRQESARLGGIGSCGRELCCASWSHKFHSVSTSSARNQQLSINPQIITGLCQKLKCCLNFEDKAYIEALSDFPKTDTIIKTKEGDAFIQKIDIFKKMFWLAYKNNTTNISEISLKNLKIIIALNKKDIKPESMEKFTVSEDEIDNYKSFETENEITRFDKKRSRKRK